MPDQTEPLRHATAEELKFARGYPMFDGVDFPRKPTPPRPVNETVLTIGIVIFAATMLLMPISLASLADLVRYIRGH